jgi:DNA repair exonuclease SbcCD nuclease subunit
MIRLVHTADIHLDACFADAGMPPGFGNRRRQSLRDVFSAILEHAHAAKADALLIAGDLFEQGRVTRDTTAFLRDAFARIAPVPVFIAPGNHDPYLGGSPYATETWPRNVHIFREPRWQAVELESSPLTVHGFAFDGFDISENPFASLSVPQDGRCHVAVGHGSERSRQPEGKDSYAPFDVTQIASPKLDYLALGHFHQVTEVTGDFHTTVYYSGAPEGHSFKETGPHHFLDIEIRDAKEDRDGRRRVHVTPVPSSRDLYASYTLDCSEFASTHQLVQALRGLAGDGAANLIARCVLTGTCDASLQQELHTVPDAVKGLFSFLDLVDRTYLIDDYAETGGEDTSLSAFLQQMDARIADAPDEAHRRMMARAREVGLAAYHDRDVPIRGMEEEAG